MPLLITKGPKVGACNICGAVGPLTEDHTPPKSCSRPTNVQLQTLLHRLAVGAPIEKPRLSQNGVKYRTLCGRCNNERLGLRYDPALADFTNSVAGYVTSTIAPPDVLTVAISPQKVVRAVLGHLCAIGVDRYQKGRITEPVRDYFLDEALPVPAGMKIFYWLYPHRTQIVVRDAALGDIRSGRVSAIWFMKFFPLAFAILWGEEVWQDVAIHELTQHRTLAVDAMVEVAIRLRPQVSEYFPEAPSDYHVLMFGRDAITATARH